VPQNSVVGENASHAVLRMKAALALAVEAFAMPAGSGSIDLVILAKRSNVSSLEAADVFVNSAIADSLARVSVLTRWSRTAEAGLPASCQHLTMRP
jgi:hypothetical protein